MHLVDINVWLGLAFQRHIHHVAALSWFQSVTGSCHFCRLTQIGFLRLATNPALIGPAAVSMSDAWRAYDILAGDPKVSYLDEPDGMEKRFRELTRSAKFSPKVWNDAYLAAFAQTGGYEIVTFGQGFVQFKDVHFTVLSS